MSDIDLRAAELAGFIAETVLYGVYLTLWVISTSILLDRHRLRRPVPTPVNKFILAGSSLIWAAVTGRWVLDCIRICRGFLGFQGVPPGTLFYFAKFGDGINIARTACMLFAGCMLDTFLVYRVYIIWDESLWHAFIPALCLLGLLLSAVMTAYTSTRLQIVSAVRHSSADRWVTAAFSMSVVTNVVAASLIAFRLAQLSRTMRVLGVSRMRRGLVPVVRIIIESAVVYSLCCIVTLALYLSRSVAVVITSGIMSSVIGISFSLIIVRVGIDLGARPYLPTSLPRISQHHTVAAWSHTAPITASSPGYPPYAAHSTYMPDELECESRETLPHVVAPKSLDIALPSRARADSEAWTDAGAVDKLAVKAGD